MFIILTNMNMYDGRHWDTYTVPQGCSTSAQGVKIFQYVEPPWNGMWG